MAKSKLKLNRKGVRELLRSGELKDECARCAYERMQMDSGEHSINTRVGKTRVNAEIVLTGPNALSRRDRLV